MFDAFRKVVNADPTLSRLGRYYSVHFTLTIDQQAWHFDIQDGALVSLSTESDNVAAFILSVDAKSWEQFGMTTPPPGYHDISAMLDQRHVRLHGDLYPWLANMTFVKGVIRHLRRHYETLCREGSLK